MVSKPNIRQTIFNGDEKGIRDFNKKLLGRIVFLYFIQKKGWLGVPAKSDWGKGDFDFLTNLFKNTKNPDLFYSELLSKLFFDTLNTKRKDDLIELVKGEPCRIPYLNGGLFEEDDKKHRNLIFPANLFKSLFDFFNQYNFTIYEDDPNDHTVAVDPEMLGHIFENLLEDNKDKGAYYTPKEIVHYMCQESLIEYLTTWFENKGYEVVGYIGFDKPDQPKLFSANEGRKGQMILEADNKATGKQIDRILIEKLLKKKLDDDDKKLIKKHSAEFHNALDSVKICDPAIGSGAFPMGLLLEIYTAKQTLHTFEYGNTTNFDASAVKLNIIQNSIYGVDIEKGAVDIARLRFWLSLIVDEPEPKALPNLDYKIVVGNSLVSKLGDDVIDIDWEVKEGTQTDFFSNSNVLERKNILEKISKEQKDFFNPDSDKKKLSADIRNLKIDLLLNQLDLMIKTTNQETVPKATSYKDKNKFVKATELYHQSLGWKDSIKQLTILKNKPDQPLHFFDWKLDFPEVMNKQVSIRVGFDIVVGNPPYIGQKGNKALFEPLKASTKWSGFYERKQDIYYYFIALGIQLISNDGNLTFINPPYFLTAAGAGNLREFIIKNSYVNMIMNLSESVKVFENASINSIILFLSKNKKYMNSKIKIFEPNLSTKSSYLINPSLSLSKYETQDLSNSEWYIFKNEHTIEFNRNVIKLGTISTISPGIQTGCDKVTNTHIETYDLKSIQKDEGIFVISNNEYLNLNLTEAEKKFVKPFYKNSAISKWSYNKSNKHWLIITNNIDNINIYPNIKKHLNKFKIILDNRYRNFALLNADKEGKWWYLYGYRPNTNFEDEKIILPYRAVDNSFAYSNESFYASIDVFIINITKSTFSTKYITCILCSKLIEYWLNNNCKRKGKILELYQKPLSELPIKETNKKIQSIFINYTDTILLHKFKGKDTSELEQEIDNLVYKLYELTYDEVKVIDPEFSLSKKEYEAIKLE
jgi:adenine-specific DNA-methyltransferase